MKEWLKKVFSSDSRSLALFRMGFGILLILDILNRGRDIVAHYTSQGVLPLDVLQERFFTKGHISIYFFNDSTWFVTLMFCIALIFAIMFLVGYRTKLATIVSWFFLISIQARNPVLLQGGDILFRLLLFWSIFLPLGRYWSFDNYLKYKNKKPERIFSIGVVALLLQVILMYISTGLLKTGNEWIPDGTAVYYALSIDQFTTNFGYLILSNFALTQFLTYFVWFYWFVGPLLLLVSWKFDFVRMLAISIFVFLQAGMSLSMKIGLFPWISIVAILAFLPSSFWDKVLPFFAINKFREKQVIELTCFNFHKLGASLLVILVSFFFIYGFLWNLESLTNYRIPNEARIIGAVLRLDQKWDMFSPRPLIDDGWFVIVGNLANGEKIDLFRNGAEVSFEKPQSVSSMYKNQRWRKYMMNLWLISHSNYRPYYLTYLCGEWNRTHTDGESLENVEMIFMREDTLLNYEISNPKRITISEGTCK